MPAPVTATQNAPTTPSASRVITWGPLLWFTGLILVSFAPVLWRLAEQWLTNDDMSHGVFVPVLVGYIVWQRRHVLFSIHPRPNPLGLMLMIIGMLFLCVGPPSLPTFVFVTRLGFLFSSVGLLLYLRGIETIIALAYPLILTLMMIPIPSFLYEHVTIPLQFVASVLSERLLEIMGYSVLREGNILHLPLQTLAVAEACSGLRSLLSLSFLAQAYIYLFDTRIWMRWAIAIAIVPIAIVANSGRIIFTAVMSQHSADWLHGRLHDSTGWVVFVVAFACLLLVHKSTSKVTDILRRRA
jgi:exosortase